MLTALFSEIAQRDFAIFPSFAWNPTDYLAEFIEFDEIIRLAAQLITGHRLLAPDCRDNRNTNSLTL